MLDSSTHQPFTRYPIQLPFLYQAKKSAAQSIEVGWTRNLSEGGACLQVPERLLPKTPLWLLLQMGRAAIPVERARVIWAGKPGFGLVRHGVAFTRIDPYQRQTLRDLIFSNGLVRPAGVRLPLELPVTARCKGQAQPPLEGRTGNLSLGGFLLRLPQTLPPATALVITLYAPTGPLTLEGETVWIEPPERRMPGEPIRHGFQFTVLDADISLALARLLAVRQRDAPHLRGREGVLRPG